jgi:hypothetical protein
MEKFNLKPAETERAAQPADDGYTTIQADTRETAASMLKTLTDVPWAALSHDDGFDVVAVRTERTAYLVTRDHTPDFEAVLAKLFSGGIRKAGHEIKDTQRRLLELGCRQTDGSLTQLWPLTFFPHGEQLRAQPHCRAVLRIQNGQRS